MRKFFPLFITYILCATVIGHAQVLNGKVLSESGIAASGVTVRFTDKANRISTRKDGSFTIRALRLPDTLIFAAPGFEPYKVLITEKNISDPAFEVVLLHKREAMTEVVVAAAGIKRDRRALGYATKTLSADELSVRVSGLAIDRSYDERGYSPVYHAATQPADSRFVWKDSNRLPVQDGKAASRLLTAGEVNDFHKWKMWEEYHEKEFREMSVTWGISPLHRFSVQLTDTKLNAMVNEKLYLIHNKTGDTVWTAYTDHTGKAELWAGILGDSVQTGEYDIADAYGAIIRQAGTFENGMNLMTSGRSCRSSSGVDIAFVVDATGSMGDEIEFLKLELEDALRHVMNRYHNLSLRAASVFYRDQGDDYVTKSIPFHDDLLKTINFIKLQQAGGGGDTPEAVEEALEAAINGLGWNPEARTRLLFLVLDAPPHAQAIQKMQQLVRKAAAKGIRIIPLACSGVDKSTEFLLRAMALASNGTYAFLTNHSAVGLPHIEPTTDKYNVELLSELLRRIIGQYLFTKDCSTPVPENTQVPELQTENILSVKIYPNPTSGIFRIESNKPILEIFIADFTGKIIMRLDASGSKTNWQVDLGRYPAAVYLVKYITEDKKWGAAKVVLARGR